MSQIYGNIGGVVHCGTAGAVNTTTIVTSSELRELESFNPSSDPLTSSLTRPPPPHIIVISGLSGIGKTQLARRFIEKSYPLTYKNVIWINAEKTESISESFKNLAEDRLNISTYINGKAKDINYVIKEIFKKLSDAPTLFVYDNVDNIENIRFLLKFKGLGQEPNVLITSCIPEAKWPIVNDIHVIKLEQLELNEAIEYVSETLNHPNDSYDNKMLLVVSLKALQMTLRQATSHLKHQRQVTFLNIADYVVKYKNQMIESKIWRVTIDAIRDSVSGIGQLAITILNIIAYFAPDNIHTDTFKHVDIFNQEEIMSAVRLLVNYSIVSHDECKNLLSVDRVVQKAVRFHLPDLNQEKPTLQFALKCISELLQRDRKIVNVSHAMSVFLSALHIRELVEEFSILPSEILLNLVTHKKYNQAKEFIDKIQEPLTNFLGEYHINMLLTRYFISELYKCQGLYTEALEINNDIFDKIKKNLGEDKMILLMFTTRSNTAFSCSELGNHAEALKIYKDIYNIQQNILGDDHHVTVGTKSKLVNLELRQSIILLIKVLWGAFVLGITGVLIGNNWYSIKALYTKCLNLGKPTEIVVLKEPTCFQKLSKFSVLIIFFTLFLLDRK